MLNQGLLPASLSFPDNDAAFNKFDDVTTVKLSRVSNYLEVLWAT